MLYEYLHNTLGGIVPAQYADGLGEGRIVVNNAWEDQKENPGKDSEEDSKQNLREESGAASKTIPSTGDDTPWAGFAVVAGLSALAGGAAIARRRAA